MLKPALEQVLQVRGDRDFPTMGSYEAFVQEVVDRLNEERSAAIRS